MRTLILALTLMLMGLRAIGQDGAPKPSVSDAPHMGMGIGLDMGGIGLRADVPVTRRIAVLGGAGYALAGIGWNAGLQYRFMPDRKAGLFCAALYGYNAAIKLKGGSQHDALYYGPSVGAGVELRRAHTANFWKIALFVPFRSADFDNDLQELKDKGHFKDKQPPWPVLFGVAYHFEP